MTNLFQLLEHTAPINGHYTARRRSFFIKKVLSILALFQSLEYLSRCSPALLPFPASFCNRPTEVRSKNGIGPRRNPLLSGNLTGEKLTISKPLQDVNSVPCL